MKLVFCLCPFLQIAAALPGSVGCGERMGLFPLEIHNGQRRFREVFALLALRPQPALLGKPTVPPSQQVGMAGPGFLHHQRRRQRAWPSIN